MKCPDTTKKEQIDEPCQTRQEIYQTSINNIPVQTGKVLQRLVDLPEAMLGHLHSGYWIQLPYLQPTYYNKTIRFITRLGI
jgi:hypothetical protein